jgi:hypothetical protein
MPDMLPAHVDFPRIDIVNAFFPSRIVRTQDSGVSADDRLSMDLHRLSATEERNHEGEAQPVRMISALAGRDYRYTDDRIRWYTI